MRIGANLTSMIDIIFLLVVFFVLVSRISEVEQVPLELPEPIDPAASNASEQARAVVNLSADLDGAPLNLRLNTAEFPITATGFLAFSGELAGLLDRNPELEVTLRADHRISYQVVSSVLDAVSQAGVAGDSARDIRMNLVIINQNLKAGANNDDG